MLRRFTTAVPASSTSRPLSDSRRDLARWIGQIDHDTSGFALPRLVEETEYSWLYQEMWLRGLHLRSQAGYALNKHYGRNVAPDPLRPLPFSFEAVIAEAASLSGMTMLVGTEQNGLAAAAEHLRERDGREGPIWAWLETYPDRRPPDLIVLPDSPSVLYTFNDGTIQHLPGWVGQAACVQGKYIRDRELYTGPAAPGERVLPPDATRSPSYTPILHNFAKALLGLGRDCPRNACCQCRVILAIIDTPPARHNQATGVLPALPDPREDGLATRLYEGRRPTPHTRPNPDTRN